jgi:hypothetical protein
VFEQFGVEAVGFFRMEVVDTGEKRIFDECTQFNKCELLGGGMYAVPVFFFFFFL